MKVGRLLARLLKLFLHVYLVFSSGLTCSYLLKVSSGNMCCC